MINKELWAFYSAPSEVGSATLRDRVARGLPYYAIPTQWRHLQRLPLTSNGKVDKAALRKLSETGSIPRLQVATNPTPLRKSWFDKDLEKGGIIETTDYPDSPSTVDSFDLTDSKFFEKDLERGVVTEKIDALPLPAIPGTAIVPYEKPESELPAKNGFHGERWLRHRFFSLYRRLFSVVLLGNVIALVVILARSWSCLLYTSPSPRD